MTFTPKSWGNFQSGGTPLTGAALTDLETRVTDYADSLSANWGGTGTVYYVDSVAGSDLADGLTLATPWASVSKVNASTFIESDNVLFKRGSTWRGTMLTPRPAQHTGVVFGAYGAGAAPILSGGVVVSGFTVSSGSTYVKALASLPGTPPIVMFASGATTTVLTVGTDAGTLTTNQYFFTGGNLYVNLGGTNPSTGTIEVANLTNVALSTAPRVTFRDLEFRFGSNGALGLQTSNGFLVKRCDFRFSTYTSNSGTLQVSRGTEDTASYGEPNHITECTFDLLSNDGIWVHSTQNVEIDHCTMTNIGTLASDVQSDAIQFENTYGVAPNSDGAWIHHNTLGVGTFSPKGAILINTDPTITGASSSAVIEYNTLIGGNYGVAPHSSNVIVRNNTCLNQTSIYGGNIHIDSANSYSGIVIAYNLLYGSNRDGIVLQDGTGDHGITIANNTIVNATRASIYLGSPVYGTIQNNILWNTGTAPTLRTLYILSVTAGQTLVCNYNLLQTAFANYLRFGGTAYSTLAAWTAATTYDANSISSDPLFVLDGSYRLKAASPAINAGLFLLGVGQGALGAPDIGYSPEGDYGVQGEYATARSQAADYTLALTDAGTTIEVTKGTAQVLTVPLNATVAFPLGTTISVVQFGAGQVTLTAAGGVTLRQPTGKALTTRVQYSTVTLRKRATDEWVVSGDLT